MTPTSHFFPQFSLLRLLATACAGFVLLIAFGLLAPKWVISLGTLALANGLVSLGILVMMRSGVVPFGQGLVFAAGGYAAALAFNHLGIRDAVLLCLIGGASGVLVAAPFAPLLARYRGSAAGLLWALLATCVVGVAAAKHQMRRCVSTCRTICPRSR